MANQKEISLKDSPKKKADYLKALGLSSAKHEKGVKAYTSLKGVKRVKTDFNHWLNIGSVVSTIKGHLKDKKINLNSGTFGSYMKVYYPLLSKNEISACQWTFEQQTELIKWRSDNGYTVSHPEAIRRAYRKYLSDSKADDSKYEEAGLKPPKGADNNSGGKSNESTPAAKDDNQEVITAKSLGKMSNAEKLAWGKLAITKVDLTNLTANDEKDLRSISATINEYLRVNQIKRNTKKATAKKAQVK